MAKSKKPRSVSRSPEWSSNACWSDSLECYAHGLEVWRATGRARLYVPPGQRPSAVNLAAILNASAPDVTLIEVIRDGTAQYLMVAVGSQWRGGEPLDDAVEPLPEGAPVRLPAISGKPQYSGVMLQRDDRGGIKQYPSLVAALLDEAA